MHWLSFKFTSHAWARNSEVVLPGSTASYLIIIFVILVLLSIDVEIIIITSLLIKNVGMKTMKTKII